MRWGTERTNELNEWWETLTGSEKSKVGASVKDLGELGPTAGHPLASTVKGSRHLNMKELRATQTDPDFLRKDRKSGKTGTSKN